jgi:hypothetical protein
VSDTRPAPQASRGSQRSVRPTGIERTFSGDELIVSKTDPRGGITPTPAPTPGAGAAAPTGPITATGPAGQRLVRSARFGALPASFWSIDYSTSCRGVQL